MENQTNLLKQVQLDLSHKVLLNDTVILLSNSELDGFREGDADLIDKILFNLVRMGLDAHRIVSSINGAPSDRADDIKTGKLIPLSQSSSPDFDELQKNLLNLLDEQYKGKNIIFYIGSRGDVVDPKTKRIIGSGSLFDLTLITQLKKRGVKIVICCLEYKFFRRSESQLEIAFQMLRQQLLHADGIHFLTKHDLTNFITTMDELKLSPILKAHRQAKPSTEAFSLREDIEKIGGPQQLEDAKNKAVFIPGIYTIPPLQEADIVQSSLAPPGEVNIVQTLSKRPPNVLCFGMIRPHKGFEEGVELAKLFESSKDGEFTTRPKVFLVGGLIETGSSCSLMRKLLAKAYNVSGGKVEQKIIDLLVTEKENLNISANSINLINNKMKYDDIPKVFEGNKQNLNRFYQMVCDQLKTEYEASGKHKSHIVFKLNVPDTDLKKFALQCKYAIKLDHKGMATNASTIVSCLGLFLPTFTASGLVTGDEFRDPIEHRTPSTAKPSTYTSPPTKKTYGEFKSVVFMPPKIYTKNPKGEVSPKNYTADEIYILIKQDRAYDSRLQDLSKLQQLGLFDVTNVTKRIVKELFEPIAASRTQKQQNENTLGGQRK